MNEGINMGASAVLVLVIGVVLIIMLAGKGKPLGQVASTKPLRNPANPSDAKAAIATFNENKEWLTARWTEANRQKGLGITQEFPTWYFDEATERQTRLLAEKGISLSGGTVSKGQASDVIGLFFPVEEGDGEVLKFFKIPVKNLNQTTARVEAVKLLADPDKVAAWKMRPAESLQKEFYRFFGFKVPTGLTYTDADDFIGKHQKTLESQRLDDWNSYESLLIDFSDKDTCEAYDIKKPPVTTVKAAIEALVESGKSLCELEGDLDTVAQKMIELKPELERK